MERIWQDYRATGVFQALALDFWNGSRTLLQSFVSITHITSPALRDAGYLQFGPGSYGILYDNYVVVDADGIVRYTSVREPFSSGTGRFNDVNLRAAIRSYLPLGVESRTWSGLKELYR